MAQKIYPNAFGGKYLPKHQTETYSFNQNQILLFKINFLLKEFINYYFRSKNLLINSIFIKYPTQKTCHVFVKWIPIENTNNCVFTNKETLILSKKRVKHIILTLPKIKLENIVLSNQKRKPFIGKNKKHLTIINDKLLNFIPKIPYKDLSFNVLYLSCYYGTPEIITQLITLQLEKTPKQNQIIETWRLLIIEFIKRQKNNEIVKGLERRFLGRINNSDRSKKIKISEGTISYSTFKSDTRFAKSSAITKNGKVSISFTINLNLSNKFLIDKNYKTIKQFNDYKLLNNYTFLLKKPLIKKYNLNTWNKSLLLLNWNSFLPLKKKVYKFISLKNIFNN